MHSTGIGGGGLMLVYKRATKTMESFDYREVAPGKSREDMFVDDATKSKTGILYQFDVNFAFFLLVLALAVLVHRYICYSHMRLIDMQKIVNKSVNISYYEIYHRQDITIQSNPVSTGYFRSL